MFAKTRVRATLAALLFTLLLGPGHTSILAQESPPDDPPPAPSGFHVESKVFHWDLDQGLGTIKVGKEFYAFEVGESTRIRVDQVLMAGDRAALEKLPDKNLWAFAQLAKGAGETRFKPRLILALGYGIEPVPTGRRNVPGVIGLLGWYKGEATDWAVPGKCMSESEGEVELAINVKETILYGTRGTPDKIKKGASLHFDGGIKGKLMIRRSGEICESTKKYPEAQLMEVPLVKLDRIVIPHKAFKALYRFMWIETFEK